jgi:hypothetical protein
MWSSISTSESTGIELSIIKVCLSSEIAIGRDAHFTALTEYSPLLSKHYGILLRILTEHADVKSPIDASNLLMDLFFDIVSELTFGKSFNALTEKQRNPIIGEFLVQQKAVGFMLQHMPLFYLVRCLPFVQERVNAWIGWYDDALEQRRQVGH